MTFKTIGFAFQNSRSYFFKVVKSTSISYTNANKNIANKNKGSLKQVMIPRRGVIYHVPLSKI
ncbi:hypothetical protein HMPREF0653_00628 [Prevotella disiens JCM 6334 = ATCC 29426]|uniref:Uncharacterized protein n=1 Tax=Prevotella disiens JCM 6334 = ATCC 29426 TaxID=1235811 RepID=A0ABN0NU91_9BACT|nr:hypothetical protein HMPREF0653_00628 [Prevotella disiens JCM 6334 = ATCC 29426]